MAAVRPRPVALPLLYFVSFSAMGVFFPFLSPWLEARGISGFWLAALSALRPLAGAVAPPLVGLLADLAGLRRSLLRATALGTALAFAALSLLVAMDRATFPVLFVLLAAFCLCRMPMTMLTDVAALETAAPFGRLRLWGSLGFLVAAALIGHLVDLDAALPYPLVITGLLAVTAAVAYLLPASPQPGPAPVWSAARALVRAADFQLFLLGIFTWVAAHSAYDLLISLHLRDLGASAGFVGAAWALGTLAEVLLMARCRSWIDRFGAPQLLVVGAAVAALRWALLAVVDSPWLLLWLQPLHAGSFALVFVAAVEHVRRRADSSVLATAQGLLTAASGGGAALAMFLWAPLYAASSGRVVFAGATLVALTSVAAFAFHLTPVALPSAAAED